VVPNIVFSASIASLLYVQGQREEDEKIDSLLWGDAELSMCLTLGVQLSHQPTMPHDSNHLES
jgi:hypothetical protein